ncbi:hypothetical protein Vadar_010270 [Vaccinium darrowii]|uniref:Uncharacterized protein n=1 Tax=Vaccinium darrowii TaxID=229202 RepID=A0ACB7YMN8_9ERIC|nr:hypothetical protein Vadar_010270 [Vaccinium darrowii]
MKCCMCSKASKVLGHRMDIDEGKELSYAGVALSTRAALLQGMSPSVFVFYRQGIATLVIAPIAYFTRRESLEKVNIRSLRSIGKIIGTVLRVGGAVSMVLLRGPKLLNNSGGENWLVGSFLLLGSSCCWSFWIIFQVPVSASYPDHLSLSGWMCSMATLQSGTVALFFERNPESWILNSSLELACCLYAGIIGSGVSFFVQAWCISRRGPLFCAMFSPLATVVVTIFASIFLHEEIYIGSLAGAVGVIVGLYVVLWGKAQDHEVLHMDTVPASDNDQSTIVHILVDGSSKIMACKNTDLEKPFLSV